MELVNERPQMSISFLGSKNVSFAGFIFKIFSPTFQNKKETNQLETIDWIFSKSLMNHPIVGWRKSWPSSVWTCPIYSMFSLLLIDNDTHVHSLYLTLSHWRTHIHTLILSLTHTHRHIYTHSLSLSLFVTHTHTLELTTHAISLIRLTHWKF